MKKFLVAAAAIAVAIIGFGTLGASTTYANPTGIMVINQHVANGLGGSGTPPVAVLTTNAGRVAVEAKISLAQLATDSASQVSSSPATAGNTIILVQSDDAGTTVALNGKGLVCTPACDNVATQMPDPTDKIAAWVVTGAGSFTSGAAVTATQTSVSLDSSALTLVGAANNVALTVTKPTVQAGGTVLGCTTASDVTAPSNGAALMTYTDVNGNSLVGYFPTFTTSSNSTVAVGQGGTPVSTATSFTSVSFLVTGTTIAGADTYCGVAAGTATLSGATLAGEIAGNTGAITRTQAITVTGVPATIALTASPAAIACDGTATSTVTAKVTDSAGNNVVDNTPITFSVVALGTANPINTTTKGGTATSVITPLSGSTSGVVVTVTSGSAASSIRIDCTPSLASPTAPAGGPGAATATPVTGVRGPNTGTGGYLGQNGSAGFPMWTLVALALGSMALVAGGVVTRRAGK